MWQEKGDGTTSKPVHGNKTQFWATSAHDASTAAAVMLRLPKKLSQFRPVSQLENWANTLPRCSDNHYGI